MSCELDAGFALGVFVFISKQGHTQSRIYVSDKNRGMRGGERGIGLSFLVDVLGTTACLVEHPYSHPWRCVFKSLSLCSSPLTRGQELLFKADDASVSVFTTSCSPEPGRQIALWVPNPAVRRHLEANKTA